jgi:hypothetical protein
MAVRVVHAINDPSNYTISETLNLVPEDLSGDRTSLPKIPLIFLWLLMGQTPGHCMYASPIVGGSSIDLTAPTEDYGPSHSSLELYSRQQTPIPPK